MNSSTTSTGTRFFAFAIAAVVTLAMFGGVDALAHGQHADAMMAKACASRTV